jgi:WD40 repeat protein
MITLIDVFQWIISWSCCSLLSGDIRGKLIFYKLKKHYFIEQIYTASYKNSPISAIKFFSRIKKKKIFISSSFDGSLKIWDIENSLQPLLEINYLNLKIFDINFISQSFDNLLIFVGLDNGFFSIFCLTKKIEVFFQYNNQGNLLALKINKNLIVMTGNDGSLNLTEFNSPFLSKKTSLFLFFLIKPILNSNLKSKTTIIQCQNLKKKFSNNILNIKLISKENYILISGNISGVINFFKLNLRKKIKPFCLNYH